MAVWLEIVRKLSSWYAAVVACSRFRTESRVKSLFVTHSAAPAGAEFCILELLSDKRIPAKVVFFQKGEMISRFQEAGVPIEVLHGGDNLLRVSRKNFLYLALAFSAVFHLIRELIRTGRECAHFVAASQKALLPCALAACCTRKPLIWWLHDYLDPREFNSFALKAQILLANLFADRVICNSEATCDSFVALGGRADKTRIVYCGIDVDHIVTTSDDTGLARRCELGLEGKFVVGCFSRLAPWKGQDLLLDCMSFLPSDTHLLLVGSALFGEQNYVDMLLAKISQLGLESRVHLIGFQADIAPYLRACDVIVHTSRAPEAFGRVIVEGMLSKRPVIAIDQAGPREIINNEADGLLVPINNMEAMRDALLRLHEDDNLRQQLACAGYESARKRFSLTLYRCAWIDVTSSL